MGPGVWEILEVRGAALGHHQQVPFSPAVRLQARMGLGCPLALVGHPEPQRGAGLGERIVSKVPHSMHMLTLIRAAGLA